MSEERAAPAVRQSARPAQMFRRILYAEVR